MDIETKEKILSKMEERASVFEKKSRVQYLTRCPLCGDSQKDMKDAHLYLKVSFDPTEPIKYYCHLCNLGGYVGPKFLSALGIDPDEFTNIDNRIFNKVSSVKTAAIDILTGKPIMDSKQVSYIQKRIGVGFEYEDYEKFKIVWDMNSLIPYVSDIRIKNTLPSNYNSITFLSDDKSTIVTRLFDDKEGRWKKTHLFKTEGRSFYNIKATLDLFTKDMIVVNIAEGVMDVLSIYKNFNDGENSIFTAILGSDYESAVNHIISRGFIGSNVILKIYIDDNIDEKKLKYRLRKYRWLFDKILIYKNIKFKDVGVVIEKIKLIEYRV